MIQRIQFIRNDYSARIKAATRMFLSFAYLAIFAIGLIVLAIEFRKVYFKRTKLKNYPIVPCLPVFGNFFDLLQCDNVQIFNFPRELMAKYGMSPDAKLICTWIAGILFMYTDHPDTLQQVLTSTITLQKGYPYDFIRNRNGLITSEPSIWKVHRKMLNPTLGPKIVNTFMPIFNEKTSKMIRIMRQQIGNNIDLHPFAFKTALESIFQAAFDVDWSMQNKKGDDFRTIILDMLERVQLRIHTVWMKLDPLYKLTNFNKLDNFAYRVFHRLVEGKSFLKPLVWISLLNSVTTFSFFFFSRRFGNQKDRLGRQIIEWHR